MTVIIREPQRKPRGRRFRRFCLFLVIVVLAALAIEHWRGKRALRAWKQELRQKGEVLAVTALWPAPSSGNRAFTNALAQAIQQIPEGLKQYAGRLTCFVEETPGKIRRGSQAAHLVVSNEPNHPLTWSDLDAISREAESALRSIRELLQNPPNSTGDDIQVRLESLRIPNYVHLRVGAQSLHTATINALHHNNLAQAADNLAALAACLRIYQEDPNLVNYMVRIAILGLSTDVFWDALQATDWTEPQLAALQHVCQQHTLRSQMPKVMEAERAMRLYEMELFSAGSYHQWIERYGPFYTSLGLPAPSQRVKTPIRLWRQWLFHPLWRFAWADQEELHYLQHSQGKVEAIRAAADQGSWRQLDQQLTELTQTYRYPAASWRFYGQLPFIDSMSEIIDSNRPKAPRPVYPYPDFTRAWFTAFEKLTWNEMVITALAIKRYHLKQGVAPPTLDALVPGLLPALPRDLMDGQLLRYRVQGSGSFLLYSVGEDFQDDGGNPLPNASSTTRKQYSPREGRDWVWPQT